MATGTGKSLVMAELTRRLVRSYDGFKVLIITHVKELIEQNYTELLNVWPLAPAGIHSAGLNSRATNEQIIFAGIQTVYNKSAAFGSFDLLEIDECHLVGRRASGMYATNSSPTNAL